MLKLAKPLKYSRRIQRINLPKKNERYKKGEMAMVIGFGDIDEKGTMVKKLRAVEVPILKLNKCKKLLIIFMPDTLCAGYDFGMKDACFVRPLH